MTITFEKSRFSCYPIIFEVNNIIAEVSDFGDLCDLDPINRPRWGCGNRKFVPRESTKENLEFYKIDEEEYQEICQKLDKLSLGRCSHCE